MSNYELNDFDYEKHWNNAYLKSPIQNLGWYEENPSATISLIEKCNLPKDALLFNAGAGATSLIEYLLNDGYSNIIVNDIASAALTELKNTLTNHHNTKLEFIVDDLVNPKELTKLKNIDLWIDRAVLHFFTDDSEQKKYFDLLKKVLKPNGYVILAEFNLEGAKKCSGLDVCNYSVEMFQERLGDDFKLIKSFDFTYIQPSGNPREFVYSLFQRML
ncbi:MAG: methyltransferase domain-containing protein [Lutibacter sp.]|uniref:class I SAM-dependent methyltransferase n=1 Tax=Lutibacter sp. TaxID=1925666 RepID=UPI001813CE41|nr:methyltransferase domain-containing protein [Lutibacter sp.]MBT8317076.1 class I SAM-dependent methyltransferase [Lutibacter sp.]NNJ57936.1 methyltransferase domain-containing protein [Lutibacter sp.]